MKEVDAEYYGYRDEDDGVLLPLEAQYEKQGLVILYLYGYLLYPPSDYGFVSIDYFIMNAV